MAPDTLEQQLLPALTQLGRFWSLNRKKWVNEARQKITIADKLTARLAQQQATTTRDLELHKITLNNLQTDHRVQSEHLRSRTETHAALTAAHTTLQVDAQRLGDQLDATKKTLLTLQTTHAALQALHQDLIRTHAEQSGVLAQERAIHQSLQVTHADLELQTAETKHQLRETANECQLLHGELKTSLEVHQQLQFSHEKLVEQLQEQANAHATLMSVYTALETDAQTLRDELGMTHQALAVLEATHAELGAQHTALAQDHAQQGSALKQEQACHQTLQTAYADLEQDAAESKRQSAKAMAESMTFQLTLESLQESHGQLQRGLAQHQEWLQQEKAARQAEAQEKAELALRHDALNGQHNDLRLAHQSARQQFATIAHLLGVTPQDAMGQASPLVTEISGLMQREALVRRVLGASPMVAETHFQSTVSELDQGDNGPSLSSFSNWVKTCFEPALGEWNLPAEQLAFALGQIKELETAIAVLKSTPLLRDKFVVAVAGGFSSGKSSFISSLVEDQTIELPSGMEPVTAIPTYVMSGDRDVIRGHTFRGGEIAMSNELYKSLSHDFAQSLGFNLRDILPYVTIETSLRHVEHLAFVDLPGYDAAASEGAYTAGDEHTATDFMQSADAVVWVVGLDSNGTLPDTDLTHLSNLSERNLPVHVVLNKADLREPSQVTEVLEQIHVLLEGQQISFIGLSAYSAVHGEELQFLRQSLLQSLGLWDRPVQPLTRVLRQFGEVMDQLGRMVEGTSSKRTAMLDAVQSLRLDFMELLSHLPNKAPEESDQDSERRSYVEHVYGADELDDLIGTEGGNGTRSSSLRRNVNKRMSQLQEGLLESVDPAAAKDLLLRMRRDGMNYLKRALA